MEKIYDLVIVGGGPGGYTAGLYGARAGLSTVVVERLSPGGQMALTPQIDNYPGFPNGVDGFMLGNDMKEGAARFGAQTLFGEVEKLELEGPVKAVYTTEGVIRGRTVVFATGANPRLLGVPREQELTGKGVSYCAHCDGMFYRDKTVAVVGGGNTAVEDAMVLSRICKKVILIHRRDSLRATKVYHEGLQQASNVEILWNSAVTQLEGEQKLSGIFVQDLVSGESRQIAVDGLFVSIGRAPASALAEGQLKLDQQGYVVAGEDTKTNLPGVFAVGDVRTKELRQIVTAVSDGAMAAYQAQQYLA